MLKKGLFLMLQLLMKIVWEQKVYLKHIRVSKSVNYITKAFVISNNLQNIYKINSNVKVSSGLKNFVLNCMKSLAKITIFEDTSLLQKPPGNLSRFISLKVMLKNF